MTHTHRASYLDRLTDAALDGEPLPQPTNGDERETFQRFHDTQALLSSFPTLPMPDGWRAALWQRIDADPLSAVDDADFDAIDVNDLADAPFHLGLHNPQNPLGAPHLDADSPSDSPSVSPAATETAATAPALATAPVSAPPSQNVIPFQRPPQATTSPASATPPRASRWRGPMLSTLALAAACALVIFISPRHSQDPDPTLSSPIAGQTISVDQPIKASPPDEGLSPEDERTPRAVSTRGASPAPAPPAPAPPAPASPIPSGDHAATETPTVAGLPNLMPSAEPSEQQGFNARMRNQSAERDDDRSQDLDQADKTAERAPGLDSTSAQAKRPLSGDDLAFGAAIKEEAAFAGDSPPPSPPRASLSDPAKKEASDLKAKDKDANLDLVQDGTGAARTAEGKDEAHIARDGFNGLNVIGAGGADGGADGDGDGKTQDRSKATGQAGGKGGAVTDALAIDSAPRFAVTIHDREENRSAALAQRYYVRDLATPDTSTAQPPNEAFEVSPAKPTAALRKADQPKADAKPADQFADHSVDDVKSKPTTTVIATATATGPEAPLQPAKSTPGAALTSVVGAPSIDLLLLTDASVSLSDSDLRALSDDLTARAPSPIDLRVSALTPEALSSAAWRSQSDAGRFLVILPSAASASAGLLERLAAEGVRVVHLIAASGGEGGLVEGAQDAAEGRDGSLSLVEILRTLIAR